jgi:hypothetical protein
LRKEAPSSAAPSASGASEGLSSDRKSAPLARGRVEEKLGTGHGEREWDRVTRTEFERASHNPAEVIRIRYDSRENLIGMGVIRDSRRPWDRSPNPFPESFGSNGYVPDPPRWYR